MRNVTSEAACNLTIHSFMSNSLFPKKPSPHSSIVSRFIVQNPVITKLLGTTPLLIVSSSALLAVIMGILSLLLLCSSILTLSLLRKNLDSVSSLKMYVYILVTAINMSLLYMIMEHFFPVVIHQLSIYFPLLIFNPVILFILDSHTDKSLLPGLGQASHDGLMLFSALLLFGIIRELLGTGQLFSIPVIPNYLPILIFSLPSGMFLILGLLLALINYLSRQTGT